MMFAWPQMLLLALVPFAVILAGILRDRRADPAASHTGKPSHVRRAVVFAGQVRASASHASRAPWRLWLACMFVVVALARPQWGEAPGRPAPQGEVIIALDLSRSMLADDVAPSRLEAARTLAARLVDALPNRRIGLIGFAGAAHVLAEPSDDLAALRIFLETVTPDHVLVQGTDFADVIDVARASFSPGATGRALVILSDGEADAETWAPQARELADDAIAVVAVGFGSLDGGVVPAADGAPFLDEAGRPIVTRFTPETLSALADETGGVYVGEARRGELAALVRVASASDGIAEGDGFGAGKADQFVWFLAAALALLAWSLAREWDAEPKLRRRSAAPVGPALAVLGALTPLAAATSQGVSFAPIWWELYEEQDPLERVKELVAELIEKPEVDAADYLELARAAERYGEIHRGHAHPLSLGVLYDGLGAIERGQSLDPAIGDWGELADKLERLLEAPPPVREEDPSEADPANERLDAKREIEIAIDEGQPAPESDEGERTGDGGDDDIGGGRPDVFDRAEWRDASLVAPLYQLEQIRASATPAELFRVRQAAEGEGVSAEEEPAGQTW